MADIGPSLQEARTRRRIDMSEVEAATKIRAKYLRALENEEWDRLPGPAYVKSFLRTYAEYLGLDAKLLVDDYKRRYERPTATELAPLRPSLDKRRDRRRPPRLGRTGAVVLAVVAVIGGLAVLGLLAPDEPPLPPPTEVRTTERERNQVERERQARRRERRRRAATRPVRLTIRPAAPVWVCLEDARGRQLIGGRVVEPGASGLSHRSRSFRITLGNGQVTLRVNGRSVDVPDRAEPVGYLITPRRRAELSAAKRPRCA